MDTKTQAMLDALAFQRNSALDQLVMAQAEIMELNAQIAELTNPKPTEG